MNEQIKELKQIALAYSLALMFDYVPDVEEISKDDINEILAANPFFGNNGFAVEFIAKKYKGWSTGDLESEIFTKVRNLPYQ